MTTERAPLQMNQFDPGDLPKPTRWEFDGS
jgi:hypothetical protein